MSDDKRVTGRSDEQVRAIAERTKAEYAVSRRRPVNILKCLESGSVPTIYGRKKLAFVVVDDTELTNVDGKTEFAKGVVTITVKRSVRDEAKLGVGRARMTLAHELAHAVMHHGTPLFRLISAAGSTDLTKETAYESAEHQAKVFAAAFLIHDEDAALMRGAEEISVQFGVSIEAAKVCLDRLRKKAERAKIAERIKKLAHETKDVLLNKPATAKKLYLDELCASCHTATLIPVGPKVLCDTCGFVGDRFQDGDKA